VASSVQRAPSFLPHPAYLQRTLSFLPHPEEPCVAGRLEGCGPRASARRCLGLALRDALRAPQGEGLELACSASSLNALAIPSESSHCFTAANFIFDFMPSRNILSLSRSVKGRAASVFAAWQRDAVVRHDAGLRTPTGITILESGWSTHAGNTGGRPKCRSGRQFARTGSVGSSDKPWDMQQAVKSIACGTQVNTASVAGSAWKQVGPGPVCRPRSGVREPVCRLRKGIRALACKCGRRGRGYSPSRSAQPLGATEGNDEAACPVAEMNTGR
jgi:hypothetical protein